MKLIFEKCNGIMNLKIDEKEFLFHCNYDIYLDEVDEKSENLVGSIGNANIADEPEIVAMFIPFNRYFQLTDKEQTQINNEVRKFLKKLYPQKIYEIVDDDDQIIVYRKIILIT